MGHHLFSEPAGLLNGGGLTVCARDANTRAAQAPNRSGAAARAIVMVSAHGTLTVRLAPPERAPGHLSQATGWDVPCSLLHRGRENRERPNPSAAPHPTCGSTPPHRTDGLPRNPQWVRPSRRALRFVDSLKCNRQIRSDQPPSLGRTECRRRE